jgi:hypothetical protein
MEAAAAGAAEDRAVAAGKVAVRVEVLAPEANVDVHRAERLSRIVRGFRVIR